MASFNENLELHYAETTSVQCKFEGTVQICPKLTHLGPFKGSHPVCEMSAAQEDALLYRNGGLNTKLGIKEGV